MATKAQIKANRKNALKAGRPKADATIRAQLAREYISKCVEKELPAIVNKAISQAKDGDKFARDWLADRGWGKATIFVGTKDEKGNELPILAELLKEK